METCGSAGGELRHDVELRVEVVQLLAHVEEDDATDERPRERRVECVRLLGETDHERAPVLRLGGGRAAGPGGDRQDERHDGAGGSEPQSPDGALPCHLNSLSGGMDAHVPSGMEGTAQL